MKRTLLGSCVVLAVLIAGIAGLAHALGPRWIEVYDGPSIRINGRLLQTENQPFVHEGRTYLPLRAIAEAVGADVEWDDQTSTVVISPGSSAPSGNPFAVTAIVDTSLALQQIRQATAKYVDVEVAKRDGFSKASGMIPNHGIHFSNLRNFLRSIDIERPAGLVYVEMAGIWTLVAVEYTALLKPDKPLLPGGEWLKHDAACHYVDGNEILESNPLSCPRRHPSTNSAYDSWHPGVWTFHVWAWFPNPDGLFAGENPLLVSYNVPGVQIEHQHGH